MITSILVRPAARGGKYLGPDAANGAGQSALVLIRDLFDNPVTSWPVYTTGKDAGPSTLMDPVSRAEPYATDSSTVGVQLQVDIDRPTTFKVMVIGPLSHIDQARTATAQITVLPGVDIGTPANPEGLVIEVPGLCISGVSASLSGPTLSCQAVVTMMCGCKINATSPYWPPGNFSIQLVTTMQSGAVYSYDLIFSPANNGNSSFANQWTSQAAPGDSIVEAWLYASEPSLGNQGCYCIMAPNLPALSDEVQKMLSEAGIG